MGLRPKQQAVLDAVIKLHSEGKNVLVRAPNGFGKTHLAGYLIAAIENTAYCAPTHMELEHAKEIFNTLSIDSIHLMSKNHLCTNNMVRVLGMYPSDACQVIKDSCSERIRGSCEYYNRRSLIDAVDTILLPHAYLTTEASLVDNRVLIIDEIHQFIDSIMSEQTMPKMLLRYAWDLGVKNGPPQSQSDEDIVKTITEVADLEPSVVKTVVQSLYSRNKHERIAGVSSLYNRCKNIKFGAKVFIEDSKITMIYEQPHKLIPNRPIIALTGTVTKMTDKLLNYHSDFVMVSVSGYSYDNLTVEIDTSTTTQSKHRSFARYQTDFNKILREVNAAEDTHILVLATSKNIASRIHDHLMNKIDKDLIYGDGSHNEVQDKVKLFRDDGGVMVSVLRGRITEGIDIPEATFLMVYGLPFLPMTPGVKFYIEKYGFGQYYASSAIAATVQSIGRGIRSPDDTMRAVLMDNRYKQYRKYFPLFIGEKVIIR